MTRDHTPQRNRVDPHVGRPQRVRVVRRAATRGIPWKGRQGDARLLPRYAQLILVTTIIMHAMENLRTRVAYRKEKAKEKMKRVAEGANKGHRTQGWPSKEAKEAAIDDEGRKLTRLIDRALHDISGEREAMAPAEAKAAWSCMLRSPEAPCIGDLEGLQTPCPGGQEDRARGRGG